MRREPGRRLTRFERNLSKLYRNIPGLETFANCKNVIERSLIIVDTNEFSVDKNWLSHEFQSVDALGQRRLDDWNSCDNQSYRLKIRSYRQ